GLTMDDRSTLRDGISTAEFKRLLRRRANIIEVGAHDGATTEGFRSLFPHAHIIAFEPEPRALAKFKTRPALHSVKLIECAVGDRNGEAVFYRSGGQAPGRDEPDWDASGSLHPPDTLKTTHQWLTFDRQMTVPITRLDDALAQESIDFVDLIWADVQGA